MLLVLLSYLFIYSLPQEHIPEEGERERERAGGERKKEREKEGTERPNR